MDQPFCPDPCRPCDCPMRNAIIHCLESDAASGPPVVLLLALEFLPFQVTCYIEAPDYTECTKLNVSSIPLLIPGTFS